MQNFLNKTINFLKKYYGIISVIIIAIIFYIGIFGLKSLDIYNYNFVLRNYSPFFTSYFSIEDINTHYLGSVFYRMDDFYPKIFFHQYLAYPFGISVLNTDSIPFLALTFKIFHKFLGLNPFVQYFGIWTLFCLIMQGIFGFKIAEKLGLNKLNSILASIFLILSPIMLTRAFEHSALTAHFFILGAIYLYLTEYKIYKYEFSWTILFSFIFLTQPNFIPIAGSIFLADFIKKIFITKEMSLKNFLIFLPVLFITIFLLLFKTGLVSDYTLEGGGYGYYSVNLNFLINPSNYSLFLKELPLGTDGQYEGICYLGLGIIILFLYTIFIYPKAENKPSFKNNLPLIIAAAILFIFAVSTRVYFNNILLFIYNIPHALYKLFSIFRTSGRGAWLIWYMIFFFSIFVLNKNIPSKKLSILLIITLFIQIADLSPIFIKKHIETNFYSKVKANTILQSEKWRGEYKNYDGIFIIDENQSMLKEYKFFWYWCLKNKKYINYGYFSRYPEKAENLQKEYFELIQNGILPEKNLIYILSDDYYLKLLNSKNSEKMLSKIKYIDGFYILAD